MPTTGKEEWKMLFTSDMEMIWNVQRPELRNLAMIIHVLKSEFNKLESTLNVEMEKFKQKFQTLDTLKQSDNRDDTTLFTSTPEHLSDDVKFCDLMELQESPKIKRYKKINYRKQNTSPSLLEVQKKDVSKQLVTETLSPSESLIFGFPKMKDRNVLNTNSPNNPQMNETILKTLDIIDSSINENHKSQISFQNKGNCTKPTIIKPRKIKTKSKNLNTLTQMIQTIEENSDNKLPSKKQGSIFDFYPEKRTGKASNPENHSVQKVESSVKNVLNSNENKNPEYPYKMDAVRRKADRMKLPGWSCLNCQKYYESLNLSQNKLQKKMNMCSKHRNKFEPLNDTPAGYWDITMCLSEDSLISDGDVTTFMK